MGKIGHAMTIPTLKNIYTIKFVYIDLPEISDEYNGRIAHENPDG